MRMNVLQTPRCEVPAGVSDFDVKETQIWKEQLVYRLFGCVCDCEHFFILNSYFDAKEKAITSLELNSY